MNPQVRLRAVQLQMDLGNNHSSLGWTIVAKNAGKASLHQFINLGAILEYTILKLHAIEQSQAFGKPPPQSILANLVHCRSHLPAHHRHHTWTAVIFS